MASSRLHEKIARNTKLKKPNPSIPVFRNNADVRGSYDATHVLYLHWHKMHMICHFLDIEPMTVEEYRDGWIKSSSGEWVRQQVENASVRPAQPPQGLLDL